MPQRQVTVHGVCTACGPPLTDQLPVEKMLTPPAQPSAGGGATTIGAAEIAAEARGGSDRSGGATARAEPSGDVVDDVDDGKTGAIVGGSTGGRAEASRAEAEASADGDGDGDGDAGPASSARTPSAAAAARARATPIDASARAESGGRSSGITGASVGSSKRSAGDVESSGDGGTDARSVPARCA